MKTSQLAIRIAFIITTVGLVTACGPRDVAQEDNGRGPGGASTGPITLSQNGERPNTCATKKPDRTYLRSPEQFDQAIYSGKVTAAIGAGNENCLRIGAVVNLQNGDKAPSRGQVTVTKIEIIPVEAISDSHAKYFSVASGSDVRAIADKEIEDVLAKNLFNPKGMVSITYFTFNKGTQTGEILEPIKEILTLDKEGDRAPGCPADYKDANKLVIAPDVSDKVLAGKITATMEAGDRNCFKIGSEVPLMTAKEGPTLAQSKVIKVQIVPVEMLDKTHAKALGIDEKNIKTVGQEKLASVKFEHLDLVHITYFQVEGVDTTDPVIPVIDPAHYNQYLPKLKERILQGLTAAFAVNSVEWDPSSLEVTYDSAVTMKATEFTSLAQANVISVVRPAFRVSLKTKKGNQLVLGNYQSPARVLVMEADIATDEVLDIEGSVSGQKATWSSPSGQYIQKMELFNESTNNPTTIPLEAAGFNPLVIDITH